MPEFAGYGAFEVELTLKVGFDVTGNRTEAVLTLPNGDPGYPEEYEEDRVISEAYLVYKGKVLPVLDSKKLDALGDLLENEIHEAKFEEILDDEDTFGNSKG